MIFSFYPNHLNDYFFSSISGCARARKAIVPFPQTPIYNRAKPHSHIVLSFSQMLIQSWLLSALFMPHFTPSRFRNQETMSHKSVKVAKNKHGVKVMGLKGDSFASPKVSKSSAIV